MNRIEIDHCLLKSGLGNQNSSLGQNLILHNSEMVDLVRILDHLNGLKRPKEGIDLDLIHQGIEVSQEKEGNDQVHIKKCQDGQNLKGKIGAEVDLEIGKAMIVKIQRSQMFLVFLA